MTKSCKESSRPPKAQRERVLAAAKPPNCMCATPPAPTPCVSPNPLACCCGPSAPDRLQQCVHLHTLSQ